MEDVWGKTVTVCADMLWWAGAYPLVSVIEGTSKRQKPIRIMTATPYENQISEIWKTFAVDRRLPIKTTCN